MTEISVNDFSVVQKGKFVVLDMAGNKYGMHNTYRKAFETANRVAAEIGEKVWIDSPDLEVEAPFLGPDPVTLPDGDGDTTPPPDPDPVPLPDDDEVVWEARDTDGYALQQYDGWFKDRDRSNVNAWLYDTPQALIELGLRTGRQDILDDGIASARQYVVDFEPGPYGLNWSGRSVLSRPIQNGDSKYTYASSIYYLHKLAGEAPTVDLNELLDGFWRVGWYGQNWRDPDNWNPLSHWNERAAAYSFSGMVYLAMMDVPNAYERCLEVVDWLEINQDPHTGAWLHSYFGHEGAPAGHTIGDDSDQLCFSPWMVCLIAGALDRLQEYAPETDVDGILANLAKGQIKYLRTKESLNTQIEGEGSWFHGYNRTGYGVQYFVFPNAPQDTRQIGWYSDLHTPEVYHTIKSGGEVPPMDIALFFTPEMLGVSNPNRLFNWMMGNKRR